MKHMWILILVAVPVVILIAIVAFLYHQYSPKSVATSFQCPKGTLTIIDTVNENLSYTGYYISFIYKGKNSVEKRLNGPAPFLNKDGVKVHSFFSVPKVDPEKEKYEHSWVYSWSLYASPTTFSESEYEDVVACIGSNAQQIEQTIVASEYLRDQRHDGYGGKFLGIRAVFYIDFQDIKKELVS